MTKTTRLPFDCPVSLSGVRQFRFSSKMSLSHLQQQFILA
jgi:hypothetical protein